MAVKSYFIEYIDTYSENTHANTHAHKHDVGGGGFFLACVVVRMILGECSTIQFPASASFFSFFFEVEISSHTNSTLLARISPQWLSGLSRQWCNVP